MQAAATGIVDLMGPNDEVAIIQFDDSCSEDDVFCQPTACTTDGKAEAQMAIRGIQPRGSTIFSAGLERAAKFFPAPAGKNAVLIFVSDGENAGGADPVQMCNDLRSQGVMVYTACINAGGVGNAGEQLLAAMAENKYFASAKDPAGVIGYFVTVLRSAQKAAITDAVVEFRPIKSVSAVTHMEFVEKNSVDVYPGPGTVITRDGRLIGSVKIDQVGPGDRLNIHLTFSVTAKEFPAGFTKEARSFGRVVLIGSCKSAGLDNAELASCDMAVTFSANPARVQNKNVQRIIGIADGARGKFLVAQTTDPEEQRRILEDAKAKVQGTMALTGDDPTLQAVLAGLGDIEQTSSPEAKTKKAREGTQVLRADDADAALAGL